MRFGDQDLRSFFRTGVCVSFAGVGTYPDGQQVRGFLDQPMMAKLGDQGGGAADVSMPDLRLPYNAFRPMPTNKDTVTVDGRDFTISDFAKEDDGAIFCYGLKRT